MNDSYFLDIIVAFLQFGDYLSENNNDLYYKLIWIASN